MGDLTTGRGVLAAAAGADLIVHAASDTRHFGRADPVQTRHLLDACTGARHLVYVSIVGIDDIPFGYYRRKLACEKLLGIHRVPYTILRATQFHELIAGLLTTVERFPVAPLPLDFMFQTVAAGEVAGRIADLVAGEPAGRADDFGGPEVLTLDDMAHEWRAHRGRPRRLVRLPIGGKVGAGFRLGREHRPGSPRRHPDLEGVPGRPDPAPGRVGRMTWLLCDYGEVLCLAPSAADRAALLAAADWDPARGDFWQAYWADRPAYDRADLSVEEYWTRLLGHATASRPARRPDRRRYGRLAAPQPGRHCRGRTGGRTGPAPRHPVQRAGRGGRRDR